MTPFVRRAALMSVLAIASPACAQTVPASESVVSPGPASRPPPEIGPGGIVVLRGSLPASDVNSPILEGKGKEATNYQPAVSFPPGGGWNHRYDTADVDNNYNTAGFDQRTDRSYDAAGFDQRFDRSGLTH